MSANLSRRCPAGRVAAVVMTAVATALFAAGAAWACLADSYTSTELTPNRTPASSTVTVSGTGWSTVGTVALNLSSDGTDVVAPLGVATARTDGNFVTQVRVSSVSPGVYYVVASQGELRRAMALEVTGSGVTPANAWAHAGDPNVGLSAADAGTPSSSGGLPIVPLAFFGTLVLGLGGWALLETRRRRVTAH